VEINGGLTPEGWADVAEACISGPGSDAVALLAGSDGPYLLGALSALEKHGKLYYVGDSNHVYIASIDGKPSTLTWLRRGYIDTVYSQTPDSIAVSLWKIAKDYILKDPSYQYPPYKMPQVPTPLTVKQPEGCYWGGDDLVMTVERVPYSKTPMGTTPSPRVDRDNVNTWRLWGNSIVKLIGEDLNPVPTFPAKGTEPAWCSKLISEYNTWLGRK
jgi:ABC-type sugar transport system substrate-binding protein